MTYESALRAYGADDETVRLFLLADNIQRFRNREHEAYGVKPPTFDPPARDEVPRNYEDRRGV